MKLLERFISWWNTEDAAPRQKTQAWRAAPADHLVTQHFDKNGRYIFKDQKNKLVADYAAQFGATMATVGFGTAVMAYGTSGGTTLTFPMSGVTSGQPIIIVITLAFGSFATSGPIGASSTDTFSTPYTYTELEGANTGTDVLVLQGGTGTSGTITVNCLPGGSSAGIYLEGYAIPCTNAYPGTNFGHLVAAQGYGIYSPGSSSMTAVGAGVSLTPVSNLQGAVYWGAGNTPVETVTGIPSSPWVCYRTSDIASCLAAYSGTPSGSVLNPAWVTSGTTYAQVFGIILNPGPSTPAAPTLSLPTNSGYADATAAITFSATYNSTDALAQNALAFRIKQSGGSYSYWTGSALGAITWVANTTAPGGTFSITLPANSVANGHVFNWSFASQEAGSNLQGAFASDNTFTAQAIPTVTVTAPTGTITATVPTTTFTPSFPSGAVQTDYQVIIESGAYTTVPGSGTSAWNSGVVASTATSVTTGVTLANATTYRVFVQITETGGQVSAWAINTFTVAALLPAAPTITAVAATDAVTGLPEVLLTVATQDNQLTANQSNLESNATTGWLAGLNTTLAASATWFQNGNFSLRLQATTAGAVAAETPTGTSGVPVTPGETVRAMAYFHSPTTARTCFVQIQFFNAAGTLLSGPASANVTSTTTGNGTGAQAFMSAVAPAGAAYMAIIVEGTGLSTSEFIYADCMFLGPGSSIPNVLPSPNDSFQGGLGAWVDAFNCVLANTSNEMSMTCTTGAFSIVASTSAGGLSPTGPGIITLLSAGTQYTAMASFRAAATSRTPAILIDWFNSSHTLISTSIGTAVADNTTGWVQAFVTATAPTGTVTAGLRLDIGDYGSGGLPAAGEVHYVDNVGLVAGAVPTWTPSALLWTVGGLVGTTTVQILRSDGQYVRGAGWDGVLTIPTSQGQWAPLVTIDDFEAAPGTPYTYTATVTSGTVTSASSASSASVTLSAGGYWWIFDPTQPEAVCVRFLMKSNYQPIVVESGNVYKPIGGQYMIKSTDGAKGVGGIIPIYTGDTLANSEAAMNLVQQTQPLCFMTPTRGIFYVMSDPGTNQRGNITPWWEVDQAQSEWQFYVIQTSRP